jgi:hypothetical protein
MGQTLNKPVWRDETTLSWFESCKIRGTLAEPGEVTNERELFNARATNPLTVSSFFSIRPSQSSSSLSQIIVMKNCERQDSHNLRKPKRNRSIVRIVSARNWNLTQQKDKIEPYSDKRD